MSKKRVILIFLAGVLIGVLGILLLLPHMNYNIGYDKGYNAGYQEGVKTALDYSSETQSD